MKKIILLNLLINWGILGLLTWYAWNTSGGDILIFGLYWMISAIQYIINLLVIFTSKEKLGKWHGLLGTFIANFIIFIILSGNSIYSRSLLTPEQKKEMDEQRQKSIELSRAYEEKGILMPTRGKNGLIGFKEHIEDEDEEWIIKPQFKDAGSFLLNDLAYATVDGETFGYIDRKGNWKIKPIYSTAEEFKEGLAAVSKGDYIGFINEKGEQITDFIFDSTYGFSDGYASVDFEGKWGFIDKKGKWLIKPEYDEARWFAKKRAAVIKNGKWGFVDTLNNFVLEK